MAVAGQISLDLQMIEDGDGTLETALRLWCSRNKPIMYNQWQSLFSQVRKAVLGKDAPNESQSERAKKMKILYDEIMLEQHGSDYKALAVKAQCTNIVYVPGPSKRAKLSGGSSTVAAEVSSTSDIHAVADDITGGGIAQDGGTEQKSIEAGTGTLVQMPGQVVPGMEAYDTPLSSEPKSEEKDVYEGAFSTGVTTPPIRPGDSQRRIAAHSQVAPVEADAAETEQECSPDGIYDNPQARELFEAYEPAETETSEEGDERRAQMPDSMMEEVPDGVTVPSIRFMMRVDVIREDSKKKLPRRCPINE